jgi:flagellar motor switch protein FliG
LLLLMALGIVLQDFIDQAQIHTYSMLSLDSNTYIRSVLNKALGDDKARLSLNPESVR